MPIITKGVSSNPAQWLATGQWFFPGTPVSSIYKSVRHDSRCKTQYYYLNSGHCKRLHFLFWILFSSGCRRSLNRLFNISLISVVLDIIQLVLVLNSWLRTFSNQHSINHFICLKYLRIVQFPVLLRHMLVSSLSSLIFSVLNGSSFTVVSKLIVSKWQILNGIRMVITCKGAIDHIRLVKE